jgi:hypothetical protein
MSSDDRNQRAPRGVRTGVRFYPPCALLLLSGCGPGLVFNPSPRMSSDEMLARASHVFVGVIEKQQFDSWPFFHVSAPGENPDNLKHWKVLRRRVRIEMVLRGSEPRRLVDVYEIAWTGGTTGDWNYTKPGERNLFLLRVEGGHYHVVRDWWRSIFPVSSGPHTRLPLDDSRPLWERIALMNWWLQHSDRTTEIQHSSFNYNDPGDTLGLWRAVKLERGLLRHPSAGVRIPACRELLSIGGFAQNECWEMLSEQDRAHLADGGYHCCTAAEIAAERNGMHERDALPLWARMPDRDERRLLTTMNNRSLREIFCRLYECEYPGDLRVYKGLCKRSSKNWEENVWTRSSPSWWTNCSRAMKDRKTS